MRIRDSIRRSAKSLRQAKIRTALTCLAISVGAVTISLALAAGAGGRDYTNEMVNMSGDKTIINVYPGSGSSSDTSEEGLQEYGVEATPDTASESTLSDKDIASIKQIDGVTNVTPVYDISTEYVTTSKESKKLIAPVIIKGDKTEMKFVAGTLNDYTIPAGKAVISNKYIKQFGFSSPEQAIGQKINVYIKGFASSGADVPEKDITLTIAAVDTETDTALYYQSAVWISTSDGKEIYQYQKDPAKTDSYYGFNVETKTAAEVAAVQQEIQNKGYEAYSLEDMRASLLQMINIAQWGMAGFGALALIASIFGIVNTQYISVLERTQQIGLMKALGARRKDISRLFTFEAAWIGFIGGVVGVAIAYGISLLNPVIASVLKLEGDVKLLIVEPLTSILLVVALMLIAVISGLLPARKAAKLDPIEALRTE